MQREWLNITIKKKELLGEDIEGLEWGVGGGGAAGPLLIPYLRHSSGRISASKAHSGHTEAG